MSNYRHLYVGVYLEVGDPIKHDAIVDGSETIVACDEHGELVGHTKFCPQCGFEGVEKVVPTTLDVTLGNFAHLDFDDSVDELKNHPLTLMMRDDFSMCAEFDDCNFITPDDDEFQMHNDEIDGFNDCGFPVDIPHSPKDAVEEVCEKYSKQIEYLASIFKYVLVRYGVVTTVN